MVVIMIENNESPVCGTVERLKWLKKEFLDQVENCISVEEIKLTVGWYLSYGTYLGIEKKWLMESILDYKEFYELAKSLTEADILNGRKPPLLREGDFVEVIVNARNITYHRGIIYKIIYHFNEKEWNYYISENCKKISKRYYYRDLRLIKKVETNKKD